MCAEMRVADVNTFVVGLGRARLVAHKVIARAGEDVCVAEQ